jgi:hypothetical protein
MGWLHSESPYKGEGVERYKRYLCPHRTEDAKSCPKCIQELKEYDEKRMKDYILWQEQRETEILNRSVVLPERITEIDEPFVRGWMPLSEYLEESGWKGKREDILFDPVTERVIIGDKSFYCR